MSGARTTPAQFDVVATTRRIWSREQKRAIVAEIDVKGAPVSAVARRHGIHSSQLFRWRREFSATPAPADEARPAATFVPVVVELGHRSVPPQSSWTSGTINNSSSVIETRLEPRICTTAAWFRPRMDMMMTIAAMLSGTLATDVSR